MALVNHSVTLALCAESTISCCSLCWMHSTFFKSSFCSQRWFFCCIFFFASHIVEISPLSCDPATISHLGSCSRVHFLVLNAFFPLGRSAFVKDCCNSRWFWARQFAIIHMLHYKSSIKTGFLCGAVIVPKKSFHSNQIWLFDANTVNSKCFKCRRLLITVYVSVQICLECLICYTKRRKAIFSLIVSHYKHNPAYKQSESVGKIFDTKMIFCNLSNDHKTFEEIAASWNLSAVVNSVQAVFNQLSVIHYLVVLALLEALKYWLLSLKSLNYNPWVPRLIFLGLHAYHNSLCMLSHQNACLDAWDGLCDVFFWAVLLWLKSNHLFLLA